MLGPILRKFYAALDVVGNWDLVKEMSLDLVWAVQLVLLGS